MYCLNGYTYLLSLLLLHSYSCNGVENFYCGLSCNDQEHTVCKRGDVKCGPDAKCGSEFDSVMTDELRQYALDLHNELRNKVASGQETTNNQPSASNMNILKYDKELEFIAQCWVNDCNGNPLLHDSCRRTNKVSYVGQNLASWSSSAPNIDYKKRLHDLIMMWYNEVAHFHSPNMDLPTEGFSKIGHYSQLVWAHTTTIGCAISLYTSMGSIKWYNVLLACNYGPGGNILGAKVYKTGTPCSECTDTCNPVYTSLCGKYLAVNETSIGYVPLFPI